MESTDTIGRGWYGVIIVPKKQKGESFHDKAMCKAAKIIVETRPDLAIGDFGKPPRERDHKVAFVLDSSGNIVVPKKRKNETRGDKAARKAAEMAVRMQMTNTVRVREDATSNDSQHHGVLDPADDGFGSIIVSKQRKGETSEERDERKVANRASASSTSKERGPRPRGPAPTEEQRLARNEARRGKYTELQWARKEVQGAWDSAAFISGKNGALCALQFGGSRRLHPKMDIGEQKCNDCGETQFAKRYFGRTIYDTWVIVCELCYRVRYSKRWRKSRPESRRLRGEQSASDLRKEQSRRVSINSHETAHG